MKLNIACGPNMFPGWINYDREDQFDFLVGTRIRPIEGMPPHQQRLSIYLQKNDIDFRVHDLRNNFPQHADGSASWIYLGQMIEHLNPVYEAQRFLAECYRMLRPGGILRITTPDLDLLISAYLNGQMNKFESEQPEFYKLADPSAKLAFIMFGAAGQNCTWDHYEGHFFLYTHRSIVAVLGGVGFTKFSFCGEGEGTDLDLVKEVFDAGMTHSFIIEAIK